MSTSRPNLGPAQPIGDFFENAISRVEGLMKNIPGKGAPPQPYQADPGMVEEANESFRKAAAKPTPLPAKPNLKPAPKKR